MKSKWPNYPHNTFSWSYYGQFIIVLYSKGGEQVAFVILNQNVITYNDCLPLNICSAVV